MRIIRKNSAVSHLLGYMLTLALTAVIITVTILTTNTLIDEKARQAADIYAENIANKVASAILNLCALKEQYPNANYSATIELPWKLVDRFRYYVEIDDEAVYVRSYNGFIDKQCTIYNATEKFCIDLDGKIDSTNRILNLSVNSFDYVYEFDFGTDTSEVGSIKITEECDNDVAWWNNNWNYRTKILITSPIEDDILDGTNYQILVRLDDTNFDYSLANNDGSDLVFIDGDNNELDYWIERWHPRDTHTSRIWVELDGLTSPYEEIHMYHGNKDRQTPDENHYGGDKTFLFFDDFSFSNKSEEFTDKWIEYDHNASSSVFIEDGLLVLRNGSAINSTARFGQEPCIIETKAKTVGDFREASMFARNDGDKDNSNAPYSHSYLFTSSNLTGGNRNLSIRKDNTNLENSSETPVNQEWNRLTYLINDTDNKDTLVSRYYYENYSLSGTVYTKNASNDTYPHLGNLCFGLCTTQQNTIAYYDWIFIRSFVANTSENVSLLNESIPYAYVAGTDSQNFEWSDSPSINSEIVDYHGVVYDFIHNDVGQNSATFAISSFSDYYSDIGEPFSFVFTVGNPEINIQNMKIDVNGVSTTLDCDHVIKKVKIEIPAASSIQITFSDEDTTNPEYYWAVGDLKIQRGVREIELSGGP